MSFDTHSTLGYSTIASVVSQNASTLVINVQTGHGSRFAINQQVTIWPGGSRPNLDNAMIGRITAIATDQLTIDITSGVREGTSQQTAAAGMQITNTASPKAFTDIENALPFHTMARQAIINGNFNVWQRGVSISPASGMIADRWGIYENADGGTLPTITDSRQALTPGDITNAFYYYRINTTGAGSSLGANSLGIRYQKIEYGTRFLAGASKKITVSFWARSNIGSKKLGIYIDQSYGGGGSPSAIEVINGTNWTLTSSWAKYTHTFTLNTLVGKTFGSDNNDYLALVLGVMWGSGIQARFGAGVAETYVGAGNIDIAQVQVCAGDMALPFQPKSFSEELRACQRYFEKSWPVDIPPGTVAYDGDTESIAKDANYFYFSNTEYKVTKRINPTIVLYSPATGAGSNTVRDISGAADVTSGGVIAQRNGVGGFNLWSDGSHNSLVAGRLYAWQWTADAEL